jgi:hypothetical protein
MANVSKRKYLKMAVSKWKYILISEMAGNQKKVISREEREKYEEKM